MASRIVVTKCYTAFCEEHNWYGTDWSGPNPKVSRADARMERSASGDDAREGRAVNKGPITARKYGE